MSWDVESSWAARSEFGGIVVEDNGLQSSGFTKRVCRVIFSTFFEHCNAVLEHDKHVLEINGGVNNEGYKWFGENCCISEQFGKNYYCMSSDEIKLGRALHTNLVLSGLAIF
jgi:hypothetical protein